MLRSLALALVTLCPSLAFAQLEIAGEMPEPPPVVVAAPAVTSTPLEPAPSPPPAPVAPAEPTPAEPVRGYSGLTAVVDVLQLGHHELAFGNPEIAALHGLRLDREWAGNASLRGVTVGGVALAFGIRPHPFVRGPELRVSVSGGEIDGAWTAGGPQGFELSLRSLTAVRFETAFGLQLPLGPVVPYAMVRGSVGAAWIDVQVRDARLGVLGTETVEVGLHELGLETGLAVRTGDGFELGFALRASFLGTESLGAAFGFGFQG
jgi:hypothetical protein